METLFSQTNWEQYSKINLFEQKTNFFFEDDKYMRIHYYLSIPKIRVFKVTNWFKKIIEHNNDLNKEDKRD
jgi:hypothetical protein